MPYLEVEHCKIRYFEFIDKDSEYYIEYQKKDFLQKWRLHKRKERELRRACCVSGELASLRGRHGQCPAA